MFQLVQNYKNDTRGVFAIKFALFGTFLLLCTGIAVDTARLVKAKTEMQSAADAATMNAAIAYVQSGGKPMQDARKKGRGNFVENTSLYNLKGRDINFKRTDRQTIRSDAKVSLEPMFVSIFGYPKLDIHVSSEVAIGQQMGAEIVIAVDATNSMAFDDNWENVMESVTDTLEDLETYTGNENVFVSIVPFKDRVNIGTSRDDWLDGGAPSDWNGCVEPREEAVGGFSHRLTDKRVAQMSFEANDADTSGWGNTKCPDFTITGPSNDIKELLEETNDYDTSGTGRFDVGLAWAWRMLSPKWRGQWDVSNYPAADTKVRKKYIVLFTDARSSAYEREFTQQQDWGYNLASLDAFEHFVKLCEDVKKDDIQIFVTRFDGNDHSEPYFKDCASSPAHYSFADDVEDVAYPFEQILSEFSSEFRFVR